MVLGSKNLVLLVDGQMNKETNAMRQQGTYRELNREKDWPFFDADCQMTVEERSTIRPLTEAAARAFWETHVSLDRRARHGMLMPNGHWLSQGREGPQWLVEHAEGHATFFGAAANGEVEQLLLEGLGIDPGARVYFILGKGCAYEAPLGVFASYHYDFLLLDDEAPFLFHPESGVFTRFGPHGQTWFGNKTSSYI